VRTSAIVVLSIAGFGFALWLARGGDPPAPATTIATEAPAAVAQPSPRAVVAGGGSAPAATEGKAAPPKLDPRSDAFRNRLDERIPTRLYAEAARCYKGGLQRDQRMDLTYRIRVSQGAVSIGDVRVTESTLGDSSLERCIHDKIVAMRWRDDELPDLEENDDLYMRVAGFSSYLANADDDDAPSSAMN
jgi:hypothetical protein